MSPQHELSCRKEVVRLGILLHVKVSRVLYGCSTWSGGPYVAPILRHKDVEGGLK